MSLLDVVREKATELNVGRGSGAANDDSDEFVEGVRLKDNPLHIA